MKDYYKLLEVNESASYDVINAAYKVLVKKYHPDLAKEQDKQLREEKMKELNLAKDILTSPAKRSKYDMDLKKEKEKRLQEEMNERIKYAQYQANKSKNEYPRKKETPTSTVTSSFKGFFSLFDNFGKNKGLIVICSFLFMIAFLQIFLVFGYSFKIPEKNENSNSSENALLHVTPIQNKELIKLKPGISKDEVITMFGIPDAEYSAYLKYGDAKVLLQDNIVIGWIDTYQQLPIIRHTKTLSQNSVKTGSSRETVLESYGSPDTYSTNFFVYDDVIIYFEKDIVTGIEQMQK